jgi:hypothetical protein
MDVSTLLLGTVLTVLPLLGAALLTAMVLLERPGAQLAPAAPFAGRTGKHRSRTWRRRPAGGRRRCKT